MHVIGPLRTPAALIAVFVIAAMPATAGVTDEKEKTEADSVVVRLQPDALMAGGDVRTVVSLDPREGDRYLRVTVDSWHFYASTQRELQGEESARVHVFTWRALPAGLYSVKVELEDEVGDTRTASQPFKVHGASAGCGTIIGGLPSAACAGGR